jgi:hypothetical protein
MTFLCLCFVVLQQSDHPPADDLTTLVEKLGSESIQEREETSHRLMQLGLVALDRLYKAQEHVDSEIACRARDLYYSSWSRLTPEDLKELPFEKLNLEDIDLHTFTVRIEAITQKQIHWTEDLGLRKRRAHIVSDAPLRNEGELLFAMYQQILQVNELVLVPLSEKEKSTYKICPCSGGKSPRGTEGDTPAEHKYVTRIMSLRHLKASDVQTALINVATFPQNIVRVDSGNLMLATDCDSNIKRFETIVEYMHLLAR